MNIIRSSAYRRMQACAAKWLRTTYNATLFGFDIRIQGKYYSVVGIDNKHRTFAIIIFENTKDFMNRKTEVITARGKFMKVMAMFPSQGVYARLKTDFGSIGVLSADGDSWRGAWRVRGGNWCWGNSKLISLEKLKDCIMRRNSESMHDLIEWIATNKGKSIDSTIISQLRHKCHDLSTALELEKDKVEVARLKATAFYNFASKFTTDEIMRRIEKLGPRDYYISREQRKESRSSVDKNGCSRESLLSAVEAVRELSKRLDGICRVCDLNKRGLDELKWSDLDVKCASCKNMSLQSHIVKSITKYEALSAKRRVSKERALK